ncbi:hypothetical protein DESPIGER_1122 [Desulfovibrio piger]|uniref:Uncharacterized protein n=1 Tax=Desulfovibrio piger TaxID=901 RepID=A0A1K1LHN3_9BACT|nr:hypothetical protein DESPIGER_1122 [Desulfovibrio piger]
MHGSLSCPLYKRCPCGPQEEGPHVPVVSRGTRRTGDLPRGRVMAPGLCRAAPRPPSAAVPGEARREACRRRALGV